jgi:DoxX-like protein
MSVQTTYAVVTAATIAATSFVAVADLVQAEFVLSNSAAVGVPRSWLAPLGILKAAGAAGLLLGLLGIPVIGEAAAIGLTVFFIGAIITHLRARNYALQYPTAFLLLSGGTLALHLAAS